MANLGRTVSEILSVWRDVVYVSSTDRNLRRSVDKGWRSKSDFKWLVMINLFAEKYNCVLMLSSLSRGHWGACPVSDGRGEIAGARAVPARKRSKESEHIP